MMNALRVALARDLQPGKELPSDIDGVLTMRMKAIEEARSRIMDALFENSPLRVAFPDNVTKHAANPMILAYMLLRSGAEIDEGLKRVSLDGGLVEAYDAAILRAKLLHSLYL